MSFNVLDNEHNKGARECEEGEARWNENDSINILFYESNNIAINAERKAPERT
jgi:hypothetical protein